MQLTRLADVLEAEAVERGTITRPIPRESPRSSDPASIAYTDEAFDYVRENSPAELAKQREFAAKMLAEEEAET